MQSATLIGGQSNSHREHFLIATWRALIEGAHCVCACVCACVWDRTGAGWVSVLEGGVVDESACGRRSALLCLSWHNTSPPHRSVCAPWAIAVQLKRLHSTRHPQDSLNSHVYALSQWLRKYYIRIICTRVPSAWGKALQEPRSSLGSEDYTISHVISSKIRQMHTK